MPLPLEEVRLEQAGIDDGDRESSPSSRRQPTDASQVDRHPVAQHRPRRQFLHSAMLLLLAEKPRHGYALTNAIADLGLGDMDRPRIYRALAELEVNGLVKALDERSNSGHVRRVYSVTDLGHQSLSAAAVAVAHERAALDNFLQRYSRIATTSLKGDKRRSPVSARHPGPTFDTIPTWLK
jgi:PadR family transcriptional regulator, regulatory protein PadR